MSAEKNSTAFDKLSDLEKAALEWYASTSPLLNGDKNSYRDSNYEMWFNNLRNSLAKGHGVASIVEQFQRSVPKDEQLVWFTEAPRTFNAILSKPESGKPVVT